MNRTTVFGALGAFLAVRVGVGPPLPPITPGEVVAGLLFLTLLWWCLSPSRDRALDDAPGRQDARQSLAFRFGQALHRVLYFRRG